MTSSLTHTHTHTHTQKKKKKNYLYTKSSCHVGQLLSLGSDRFEHILLLTTEVSIEGEKFIIHDFTCIGRLVLTRISAGSHSHSVADQRYLLYSVRTRIVRHFTRNKADT